MPKVSPLTCGERAVRCLLGETVDHIPFGVGVGWNPWPQTAERWKQETGNPDLNIAVECRLELSFINPQLNSGMNPGFEPKIIEEGGDWAIVFGPNGVTSRERLKKSSLKNVLRDRRK